MAKPMLVTLPFVLLLFDVWPLGRLRLPGFASVSKAAPTVSLRTAILEKLPLLALVAVSAVLTLHAQKQVGALSNTVQVSLALRVCNAFIATFVYIAKLFVPIRLAALYPYPERLPLGNAVVAALLLLAVTVVVWRRRDRAPYGLTGWLWFLGTLVPVIGLVQVGSQSMADRYTYIPHIGLYLLLVWAVADALGRARAGAAAIAVGASAAFAVLAAVTWVQVGYWQNGTTLFGHTIAVTDRNFIATNNYGVEMLEAGQLAQAQQYFELATRYNPRYETALYNLGVAYRKQEKYDEAAERFRQALAISPDDARAQLSLAIMLAVRQNFVEAIPHYERALALAPTEPEVRLSFSNALNNYGVQLSQQGRQEDAIRNFRRALEIKPGNADAQKNLDFALKSGSRTAS